MPELTFEIIWQTEPPDGRRCIMCEQPIYSDVYVLYLKHPKETSKVGVELCEGCYEAISSQ